MRASADHVAFVAALDAARDAKNAAADAGDWVAAGIAALRYRDLIDGIEVVA